MVCPPYSQGRSQTNACATGPIYTVPRRAYHTLSRRHPHQVTVTSQSLCGCIRRYTILHRINRHTLASSHFISLQHIPGQYKGEFAFAAVIGVGLTSKKTPLFHKIRWLFSTVNNPSSLLERRPIADQCGFKTNIVQLFRKMGN